MGYPDYPNNRLIVDGVDLTEKFKMVLTDGYTLAPPEPKTYVVDVPGSNGSLDLTETLLGDTAYKNRSQEFTFYIIDAANFEKIKTQVSNFLHGRSFDYQITMDPEYTYHGRFTIDAYSHLVHMNGKTGVLKVTVDAEPFKHKPTQIVTIDAIGGNLHSFESGRERVRPVIKTEGYLKVIHDGKIVSLPQGTWAINDLLFVAGTNEVYFNSYDIHNLTWGDLKTEQVTWGEFKKHQLYIWYKSNGDANLVKDTWADLANSTWSSLANKTWIELRYGATAPATVKDVIIEYEWGDL